MRTPEIGSEIKEQLQPTPDGVKTAEQIDNVSRMLAGRADKIDAYENLAPLSPNGYSSIASSPYDKSEVYVKEDGSKPGEDSRPTITRISGPAKRATVTTESGVAEGKIESKFNKSDYTVLDDKDNRAVAATALWEKRAQLRKTKEAKEAEKESDLSEILKNK